MRGGKWLLVASGGAVLAVLDAVVNDLSPVIGDERSLGDGLLRVVSLILNSASVWGALGVGAGFLASSPPVVGRLRAELGRGASAGGVCLVSASVAYFLYPVVLGRSELAGEVAELSFWAGVSVVAGLLFGAVGALMRRPGAVGLVAGLVVAVGAVLGVTVLNNWGGDLDSAGLTATALLLAGVAVAVVAVVAAYLRSRRRERTSRA